MDAADSVFIFKQHKESQKDIIVVIYTHLEKTYAQTPKEGNMEKCQKMSTPVYCLLRQSETLASVPKSSGHACLLSKLHFPPRLSAVPFLKTPLACP